MKTLKTKPNKAKKIGKTALRFKILLQTYENLSIDQLNERIETLKTEVKNGFGSMDSLNCALRVLNSRTA